MTKAKRLFDRNYTACRRHIKTWGFEGIGFNRIECEDDESIPTRTCNEIQKEIDRERKYIETGIKLNVFDGKKAAFLRQSLDMLQITLNNQKKHNTEFKKMMKDI